MSDKPTSETDPTDGSHTNDTCRAAVRATLGALLDRVQRVVDRPATATAGQPSTSPVVVADGGQSDAKIIGHNTDSGQTVGVWGEVDSSDGCGLATPDDARIDGDIESPGGHTLTVDGTPTLRLGLTGTDDLGNTAGGNIIGGYQGNGVQNDAVGATVTGGGSSGTANVPGGSRDNTNLVTDDYGTISGGVNNRASNGATIGGGFGNTASGEYSSIGGGPANRTIKPRATIAGGSTNFVSGPSGTIGGGEYNAVVAEYGTIAGGGPEDTATRQEKKNSRNHVYDNYGTIGGGGNNQAGSDDDDPANSEYATVSGGRNNTASGTGATVSGGVMNDATSLRANVGGGNRNGATGADSTVSGGAVNVAGGSNGGENTDRRQTVGGGAANSATAYAATIAGGESNTADGSFATIPGGRNNRAQADDAFAAGRRAKARDAGAFVWADSTDADFESNQSGTGSSPTGSNTFHVRATGGLRLVTGLDGNNDPDAGVYLSSGGSSWQTVSARAAKQEITPVDPGSVLDKLEDIDVATWEYEHNDGITRMGPMAGEFHDAFGLGDDPETIGHVDADGVAFAAIQGLSTRLDQKDDRIEALEAENDEKSEQIADLRTENEQLRDRLAAIEAHLGLDEADAVPADD